MNWFATLNLELNLELSPSSQSQSQQAEIKLVIKFQTKLLPVHGPIFPMRVETSDWKASFGFREIGFRAYFPIASTR